MDQIILDWPAGPEEALGYAKTAIFQDGQVLCSSLLETTISLATYHGGVVRWSTPANLFEVAAQWPHHDPF